MRETARRLARHPLAQQGTKFVLVGAVATAAHYAILIALVELAGMAPVLATTAGYCVGIAVSYALNRRFTFASRAPLARSFGKFALLYAVGALLNGAIMAQLIAWGAAYLLAQVIATSVVLFWNFAGARFVVFRSGSE